MPEFVVIAGMSGAGRTQAGDSLEDLGWFVIDNLPPELVPKVAELADQHGTDLDRVAFVLGTSSDQTAMLPALDQLRSGGAAVRVLFLDATDEVLIRRYESTKRRHPRAADAPLAEAIAAERVLLTRVREAADLVIDTSGLTIYDLRARMAERFGDDTGVDPMRTSVLSFGYKHGLPQDVDIVLDCRFLPNPYWDERLRPLSGLDKEVVDHLMALDLTVDFLARLGDLLDLLVPAYRAEGKAYLTIALGCTGGRHRSVAIAEAVARHLSAQGVEAWITHRDLDR